MHSLTFQRTGIFSRMFVWAIAVLIPTVSVLLSPSAQGWEPKRAPIMTQWAAQVDPQHVLPDYPRPQMVRADWLNLNGIWQYQPGQKTDGVPVGKKLSSEILVPFGVESALSGVMEQHSRIWYRRMVTIPPAWKGKRVLLHFGAVDYESELFVNGHSVGIHKGGYDPFSYDITPFLQGDGDQELIVRIFNPVDAGGQPRGKQTTSPGGIMYTSTTGIWQTVWLEPVPTAAIGDLHIVPDVDNGLVRVTVNADGAPQGTVKITVKDGDTVVQSVEGKAGAELSIPVPNAKLWSPDSPFLYDLEITLNQGAESDHVTSYFGMRKISIGEVDGVKRMLLNGKFVFQFGPLDQGFWPDGIYTAPTEAAMKNDIQQIKALGFNMVRKHIKVEPARWYYWTDKLGLLVWQDMPSPDSYPNKDAAVPPVDRDEFESELNRMIRTHWNVPSIITWVIFNETQGQPDEAKTRKVVDEVRKLDPSRLINEASGWTFYDCGDLNDLHHYPPPDVRPVTTAQAYVCGEYGGIGLKIPGHTWVDRGGGYTEVSNSDDLIYLYSEFANRVKDMRDHRALSAAVYTQLTDVMTEINGLMTYDRVPKCDFAKIAEATHFSLPQPVYRPVLATSETGTPQTWKYTTRKPSEKWNKPDFDDSKWSDGAAGFGAAQSSKLVGQTAWKTQDIWLRKHFNPGNLTPDQINNLVLQVYHDVDVDTEISINGAPAYKVRDRDLQSDSYCYQYRAIAEVARKTVVPNSDNLITIHCRRSGEGQYIDLGLDVREASQ